MTALSDPIRRPGLRIGMVSTVPPTACGLATFSEALAGGLRRQGVGIQYAESMAASREPHRDVVAALGSGSDGDVANVADKLNENDLVVIQHEYGIYPGNDGDRVLELVQAIHVPMVVVVHTVLSEPSAHQREILSVLCRIADAIVVMTETGRQRLQSVYGVDLRNVHVVAHGAAVSVAESRRVGGRRRLLSWGLLGPGKGIEWAIDAVARLVDEIEVEYVVAGATHPNVLAREGEEYRRNLIDQAHRLGVSDRVAFDDAYRSVAELATLIATADLVVLPYDSRDQVTSGVLVDAVAAGRPVISTTFPHAVELLASGAGVVVPQRDPAALADAIRSVLTDADRFAQLEAEARRLAPTLSWDAVAERYARLFETVMTCDASLAS